MKTEEYYIMTFASVHHAIKAERQIKRAKLEGELIPTPRDIDISCGLSIKLPGHCLDKAKELSDMPEEGVNIYKAVNNARGKTFYMHITQ